MVHVQIRRSSKFTRQNWTAGELLFNLNDERGYCDFYTLLTTLPCCRIFVFIEMHNKIWKPKLTTLWNDLLANYIEEVELHCNKSVYRRSEILWFLFVKFKLENIQRSHNSNIERRSTCLCLVRNIEPESQLVIWRKEIYPFWARRKKRLRSPERV